MKFSKEKIAFCVVLLILLGLGWMQFASGSKSKKPRRRRGRVQIGNQLDLDTLVPAKAEIFGAQEKSWSLAARNVFRAPSDYSSLPPVALPAPPRPTLPVSAPAPVPGPDAFRRVAWVKGIDPVFGVVLPDREGSSIDDVFAEEEPEPDEAASATSKPASRRGRLIRGIDDLPEEVEEPVRKQIEEALKKSGLDLSVEEGITSGQIKVVSNVLGALEGAVKAQQDKNGKKRKPTASERRIKSLEERLKKKTIERIQEERQEIAKTALNEDYKKQLDKINWPGEIWYGQVLNDAEKKAGQSGLDRYQIKLKIDELRAQDNLTELQLEGKLKDRDLEVEFRRWRKGKFDRKQKLSAAKIRSIDFGDSPLHKFEVARRRIPTDEFGEQVRLTRDLVKAGLHPRAVSHLLSLRDAGAKSREFFAALADAAHRAYNYDVEMETISEGLALFPEDIDLISARGEIYSRLGLADMAEADFAKALEKEGRSSLVNARFGRHLLERGGHLRESSARAASVLRRALDGRFEVESDRLQVEAMLARALMQAGKTMDAQRRFQGINDRLPADADGLKGLGVNAYLSGDIDEAKKKFNEVLEDNPLDGPAYYNLGLCYLQAKEWREARDSFLDAAEADPLLAARAKLAVGYLHEKIGRSADAQSAYLEAYEADPSDPEVVRGAGRAYLLAGDYLQAQEYYERALASMPGEFELLLGLSETSFQLGRSEAALRYTDAALVFAPNNDGMHLRRAQILMKLERAEEAKASLDRAKKIRDSKLVEVAYAHYYYSLGNFDESLKRFRSVAKRFGEQDASPLSTYVRNYEAEIADNLDKQVWNDHFNRAATAGDLLREWKSYAPGSGIQVTLADNKVVLRGKQRQSEVCSCVFQQRRGKEFVSFEAALEADPNREFTAGIAAFVFRGKRGNQNSFVDSFSGGLAFEGLIVGMTPEGRLGYRVVAKYELGPWQPVGSETWPKPVEGKAVPIRLGIEVDDQKKGTYRILVNGESALAGIEVKGLQRAGRDMQLWAFTQSEIDKRVELRVDDVRIVTRKGKK
ncbi:MAG: tetratricopeptide repeat protein [Planctomycetota bacterium]